MTVPDTVLQAVREVKGCGWQDHNTALNGWSCDCCEECLSLLIEAVIQQAVERVPNRVDENRFCPVDPEWCAVDRWSTVRRSSLLAALLPTTSGEPTT